MRASQPHPGLPSPPREPHWPARGAWALCILVVSAYAWLLPAGRWGGDEFFNFASAHDLGLAFIPARLAWSPRPVSEAILALYGLLCWLTERPLIAPLLALLWAMLAASLWLGVRGSRPAASLIAVVLLCLFLTGHSVGELFFTPAMATPYLPTLAAISLVVLSEVLGSALPEAILAAALVVAAWSSEAGAIVVLALLPVLLTTRPCWPRAITCAAGLACAGLVFLVTGEHRGTDQPVSLVLSLLTELRRAGPDFASINGTIVPAALAAGLAAKAAFAGGVRLLAAPRSSALLAASLCAGCILLEIAAIAADQDDCCKRHEALRQCLYLLAIVAVCGAGAPRLRPTAGAALLALSVLITASWSLAELGEAWRARSDIIKATARTWRSGTAPGPGMIFHGGPPGGVLAVQHFWPPGHFVHAGAPWYVVGVLGYFGKQSVDIVP